MQEQIEPILQRIASHILSEIDAAWSKIIITGEAFDGSLELDCRYQIADTDVEETLFAPSEVLLDFLRLRFMLKEQTGKGWYEVRFEINPDSTFDIRFTYPTEHEL